MTDVARGGGPVVETIPPTAGSLEARASLALKVMAGIGLAGLSLAALPGGAPEASLYTAVSILATAGIVALSAVEAIGLDRRRGWAGATVRPFLALVGVVGAVWTVLAFGQGGFRIPYEPALAAWAWLGPADDRSIRGQDRRSLAVLGATAALVVVSLLSKQVFGWGGALDVREGDIHAAITADCAGDGSGVPAALTVTYEWSWSAWSPFPSGLDLVVIGWTGDDGLGRPLYILHDTPPPSFGVYPGRSGNLSGEPSLPLAKQAATESRGSWRWGVEVSEQQLGPGRIQLVLRRAQDAPPDPGPLTIRASYIHVGLWRHDALTVTCSW